MAEVAFGRLSDEPIVREWFERHPVRVAFDLIGAMLVVDRNGEQVVARIVEVEAYGGMEDLASHATMYRVGRESIGSEAGVLYMQRSYGLHTMTNIVAHEPKEYGAVLLRAAEDPVEGLGLVKARRSPKESALLVGPGNLSRGVGTRLSDTLLPLDTRTGVTIFPGPPVANIMASPRIGITRAEHARWRMFDSASRFVSRHRRGEMIEEDDLGGLIAELPTS